MRCTGLNIFASAAGGSVCVASPLLGSVPGAAHLSHPVQHGLDLLCDSLRLFFSLPENPSSSTPSCKESVPHLPKHFGDIVLRLTCNNESLSKHSDAKGSPRIIFEP